MGKDTDRFGNRFAPNLSYARGKILATTADDFTKLQKAWAIIRERGPEAIYIFTGLDHSLPMEPEDLRWAARMTEIFRDDLKFTKQVTHEDWQRHRWRNFFYLPLIPLRDQL